MKLYGATRPAARSIESLLTVRFPHHDPIVTPRKFAPSTMTGGRISKAIRG